MEKVLFDLFASNELYLVGGIVRDRLLGRESSDYDFTTNLLPEETEKVLQKAGYRTHDIGKAFGTISVMLGDQKVEITTFRKNEKYTRDNRRPRVEWGTSINDDLIRRDFTINAMAIDRDGKVIDLFNGQKHLAFGIIDTPMDAEEIFSDDPLRILRAVRFRSRFGFKYSDSVKKALASQAYRLLYLPKERILDEFNKILLGDYVEDALKDLLDYKILNYIVPELTVMNSTDQVSKYHTKNVWLHTVGVVANAPKDLALKYAALFHDIGKSYTKTVDDGVHFYHHEDVSALMVSSILFRMGLPRKLNEEVTYLVHNHMRPNLYEPNWSDSAVRRLLLDTGDHLDKLLKLSRADITSHNPAKVALHLADLEDLIKRIEEQKNYKVSPKCPLDGKTIMDHFKLSQGKEVGRLKDILMAELVAGTFGYDLDKEFYLKYLESKINSE